MITGPQMRAARALLGMDQATLARQADLSLPTIRRMEASPNTVRGVVDSLVRVVAALEAAGIELIAEGAPSAGGGRGVRLREPSGRSPGPAEPGRSPGPAEPGRSQSLADPIQSA